LALFLGCGPASDLASKKTARGSSLGSSSGAPVTVSPSPDSAKEMLLPRGTIVVDMAVMPNGAEAVLLVQAADGRTKVMSWTAGQGRLLPIVDLPAKFMPRAIATHPSRSVIFVSGTVETHSRILAIARGRPGFAILHESAREIAHLMVAPRPFGLDTIRYRLFYAAKVGATATSLRSVSDAGTVEYQVVGPKATSIAVKDAGDSPNEVVASSGVPMSFHPRGEPMLWRDDRGCAHSVSYGDSNWGTDVQLSFVPCDTGWTTITPNGATYLHWRGGEPGVTLIRREGAIVEHQAREYMFASPPISTPDGKGVIGLVNRGRLRALVYTPIAVPLADVVNAWELSDNACQEELFVKNAGLFQPQASTDQLYSLYERTRYNDTPPPLLVTTDLFWENFAAAFNGVFILLERRHGVPAFWSLVTAASAELGRTAAGSQWERAFAALAAFGRDDLSGEADRIANGNGPAFSTVLDTIFDFGELKPRGHYSGSPEARKYFRAVHYLTEVSRRLDPAPLAKLSADVGRKATDWIGVYRPFVAASRAPLVWMGNLTAIPASYARRPWQHASVFPLSWGIDNETLESTVLHSAWPPEEQIGGPKGPRLQASGVDVAAALGSGYARRLLSTALDSFPRLGPVLDALSGRRPTITDSSSVNEQWVDALSTEWGDTTRFPGLTGPNALWSAKRLQTGLASWATLREATVLVTERATAAEAGEGGFEPLIPDVPRGYVEPSPRVFEAIARLYDALGRYVRASQDFYTDETGAPAKWHDEPLRLGVLNRLNESAAEARQYARLATKQLRREMLTEAQYDSIRSIGGAIEHELLVYKSLAEKDLALPTPDPLPKIADVAGNPSTPPGVLEVAVGGPLEWRQIVPFFGRRLITTGSVYSYYEFASHALYDNEQWRKEVDSRARPPWVQQFIAPPDSACRSAAQR
jgi:hypothetical protein